MRNCSPAVGTIDLNIHHSGAIFQICAGNAKQSAHHSLAQAQLVLAVVLNDIARNGAVIDRALCCRHILWRIVISNTDQSA